MLFGRFIWFRIPSSKLVEELRKDKEIETSDSDSDLDLYSDVLDQIDEFAIKIESLKSRLS